MHQISILNPVNTFNFLELHLAKVKFVCKVFEGKKCLSFDTGRFLVSPELRTNP